MRHRIPPDTPQGGRASTFSLWHRRHCPRVRIVETPEPCGAEAVDAEPWPMELDEEPEWSRLVGPGFAGRSCLQAWKAAADRVCIN